MTMKITRTIGSIGSIQNFRGSKVMLVMSKIISKTTMDLLRLKLIMKRKSQKHYLTE
jgi:hypothetical protein